MNTSRSYFELKNSVIDFNNLLQVKEFMSEKLSKYKQLEGGVVFVDELPKSTVGKILKKSLRVMYEDELKKK